MTVTQADSFMVAMQTLAPGLEVRRAERSSTQEEQFQFSYRVDEELRLTLQAFDSPQFVMDTAVRAVDSIRHRAARDLGFASLMEQERKDERLKIIGEIDKMTKLLMQKSMETLVPGGAAVYHTQIAALKEAQRVIREGLD